MAFCDCREGGGRAPSAADFSPRNMSDKEKREAFEYADRIHARLPRRLQELREGAGMSRYALWMKCGVSRDMISRIESGKSVPTLHVAARLAYGVETTLKELCEPLDDAWPAASDISD